MIKLSIIIPCYNAEPYIQELLECLDKQIRNDVEVYLIDDGSDKPFMSDYTWLSIIRQQHSGISIARNKGLDIARGELISFIDADDLIAIDFIEKVIKKLDIPDWDYMDLSWRSLESNDYIYLLKDDNDKLPNPSASTRIFRRSFIGAVRFNEKKDACEDEEFTRKLDLRNARRICMTEMMYYYRLKTPESNSKKYLANKTKTKRIVYYFNEITVNMTYLINEVKKEDEFNEVIIMTNRNDIPELERYAQIWKPFQIEAYEARGENNNFIIKMK